MAGLMNAGRIHKNELGVFEGENAKLTAACGLRTRRNGGDFLPKQRIEQSGLAHIGASDNGDKT